MATVLKKQVNYEVQMEMKSPQRGVRLVSRSCGHVVRDAAVTIANRSYRRNLM